MTTPASATASPAATAVSSPPPTTPEAGTPVDFTALLLLLLGVGTGAPDLDPQLAGDASADGADDDDDRSSAPPSATVLPAAAAVSVLPFAASITPAAPAVTPAATDAATIDGSAAPAATVVAAVVSAPSAPAVATVKTPPASATKSAAAGSAPATVDGEVDAAPLAQLAPPAPSQPTTAGSSAASTVDGHAAGQRTAAASEERLPAADVPPPAAPAPSAPTHVMVTARSLAERGADTPADAGDDHGQRGLRHDARTFALEAAAITTDEPAPAPVVATRESDGVAASLSVEPRLVADQVVSAARIVVLDGLTRMRVDLDPPQLGAVRVSADARGEAVALTITAERPETQALLTQALPAIQQALSDRGVGGATVAVLASPLSDTGRRAPDRRPAEPRERSNPSTPDRRRAPRAPRTVSAVDITV